MMARKFDGAQHIFLTRALDDDARRPLGCLVPIKDASRAFIGGIAGKSQTSFESRAQALDSLATDVIPVGYLEPPAADGEPKRARSGGGSFDEVTSRVPAHV